VGVDEMLNTIRRWPPTLCRTQNERKSQMGLRCICVNELSSLELGTKRSAHAPKTKSNVCKLQVIYFEYGFISDTTENMRLSISVLEIIIAQSLAVLMYKLEKQNKTFEN
jgi:hypothetical protein